MGVQHGKYSTKHVSVSVLSCSVDNAAVVRDLIAHLCELISSGSAIQQAVSGLTDVEPQYFNGTGGQFQTFGSCSAFVVVGVLVAYGVFLFHS